MPSVERIKKLAVKYREIILYLAVGGFTTLISFGMYFVFAGGLGLSPQAASAWADAMAIAVAYPLNKVYVFQKKRPTRSAVVAESAGFFASRAAFLVLSAYLMHLTVSVWQLNEPLSRAGVTALVVALNYIVSKFIVFRKK